MKTVILCNRLSLLRAALEDLSDPVDFISLESTSESFRISGYLRQQTNAQEILPGDLFRERRDCFREKFIKFIGEVNERNWSLPWWGIPITDKSPTGPDLLRDTANFLLITELVRGATAALLVITDSRDLAAQVKIWAKDEPVDFVNLVRTPWTWRSLFKQYSPAGILLALLRTVPRWIFSRRFKPAPNLLEDHLVVTSLTHLHSFPAPQAYRDAYFGPLIEHLATSEDKALIFAMVQEQPLTQLKKMKILKDVLPVVPLESCLTFKGLLACTFRALIAYASPSGVRGPVEIDGFDLRCLVNRVARAEKRSGNLFMNLIIYYCASELARTIRITRCLYPYENMAWEKMLLLGMRAVSPGTSMVGYQHASLTLSHTGFVLGAGEAEIMPLPDEILTTGEVTKEWLERTANYPPGTLKAACALRQGGQAAIETKPRQEGLRNILVALGTSVEEYVNTLLFLEQAFAGSNICDLRVRPHPLIPLESALEIAPLINHEFYTTDTGPLRDALDWAEVVLYASSTVGLEAVSAGVPAVYIDLGNYLDTDPMFGWNEFKWPVKEPAELIETLQRIEAIPETRFQALQKKGRAYAAAYLRPATPCLLRTFSESNLEISAGAGL